jgi:hypothetical protein
MADIINSVKFFEERMRRVVEERERRESEEYNQKQREIVADMIFVESSTAVIEAFSSAGFDVQDKQLKNDLNKVLYFLKKTIHRATGLPPPIYEFKDER